MGDGALDRIGNDDGGTSSVDCDKAMWLVFCSVLMIEDKTYTWIMPKAIITLLWVCSGGFRGWQSNHPDIVELWRQMCLKERKVGSAGPIHNRWHSCWMFWLRLNNQYVLSRIGDANIQSKHPREIHQWCPWIVRQLSSLVGWCTSPRDRINDRAKFLSVGSLI